MQEVSKREGEINGYATDVERQLRARSRATSQALAALLRQIDGARARELCAAAEAAPPDAKRRLKELQQGASCPGAEDASLDCRALQQPAEPITVGRQGAFPWCSGHSCARSQRQQARVLSCTWWCWSRCGVDGNPAEQVPRSCRVRAVDGRNRRRSRPAESPQRTAAPGQLPFSPAGHEDQGARAAFAAAICPMLNGTLCHVQTVDRQSKRNNDPWWL